MRRVSVPGKAMLAGEYSVLLPGQPCLVAGVERRLFVEAEPAPGWSAHAGPVSWTEGEPVPPELSFVVASIEAMRARYALSPMRLRTDDQLRAGELKLGLGGSAAVTVGTVWAIAPDDAPTPALWAIADDVHRAQQGGRGSGADIAASVHGGVVRYVREPRSADAVRVHPDVRLLLVWTGNSARTSPRLVRFDDVVREQPEAIRTFSTLSAQSVAALAAGLEDGSIELIRGAIGQARSALRGLEAISGMELETTALRLAADVAWEAGAAGKLSGAGGGDCAIALAVGDAAATRVSEALVHSGLTVIPVALAGTGVTRDGLA